MGVLGNLIIDNRRKGLPHAVNYYETFREEVSPLGPINFATRFTTLMGDDASLELLLEIMLKLPADGVIVLVCHAYGGGLFMPTVRRGVHHTADNYGFKIMNSVIEWEAEANRIRKLPNSTPAEKNIQFDRWRELCNSMERGCLVGVFSLQEAETAYALQIEERAKVFEFPMDASQSRAPAFRAFLAKVLAVRKQNRPRLELRACDLGRTQDGLDGVRKFFNVQKVVAPDVETFFMPSFRIGVAAAYSTVGRSIQRRGVHAGATPGPVGVPTPPDISGMKHRLVQEKMRTRGFVKQTIPGASAGDDPVFAVVIGLNERENEKYVFDGSCTVISAGDLRTPDWLKVKEFLQQSVTPLPVWSSGPFPLAGLWTFDVTPNMPFLLPLDPDYVKHLIVSPPNKP